MEPDTFAAKMHHCKREMNQPESPRRYSEAEAFRLGDGDDGPKAAGNCDEKLLGAVLPP